MLKKFLRLNLQLFADGGDGGDGGASATEGGLNPGEEEELARIPERGRELYKEVVMKGNKPKEEQNPEAETAPQEEKPSHIPYLDLIKSDEYKEEHKAYMDKAIQNRFKRDKDLEEVNSKMADALSMVADKYGIDPSSEGYLDHLTNAIKDDNSYVESYAMDHDMSPEEARKSLDMQRKIARYEAEKRAEEQRQAQNYQMQRLMASAEKTKELYPDFDLDMEMQNEEFRIICAATQGDTTKAYRSVHGDEIFQKMAKDITEKANQQIANTVAANRSRPVEGGLSSQAATITAPNFESMTAEELKAWGEEQMAKGR